MVNVSLISIYYIDWVLRNHMANTTEVDMHIPIYLLPIFRQFNQKKYDGIKSTTHEYIL